MAAHRLPASCNLGSTRRAPSARASAQQPFHLLDCFANLTAWLTGLNLALQFNEGLGGGVETACQNRRNVQKHKRVFRYPHNITAN